VNEAMKKGHVLTLRQDLKLQKGDGGVCYLQSPSQYVTFKGFGPGMYRVMEVLTSGGAAEEDLSEIICEVDGPDGLTRFYFNLQRLIKLGFICYSVLTGADILATYVPFATDHPFNRTTADMNNRYIISRFAYSRREGRQNVLESPLARARIVLKHWRAVMVVYLLADSRSPEEICTAVPGLTTHELQQFLSLVLHAAMVEKVDSTGTCPEEQNDLLRQWEFHDLLFHTHSRTERNDRQWGGTYRFCNSIEPLPANKPPMSEDRVPLYIPDMERLREQDYPFTLVLEERKSLREHCNGPITARQLGEFLYRSSRVRSLHHANPASGNLYDVALRPHPSAGACYELEIYLCINRCEGVDPGLYHYAPDCHELERLSGVTEQTKALLKESSYAAGLHELPAVSIHITARFQRVSWKYEAIAYSLILKNVGVLYQTMYLVATAMDLASTALGGSSSELLCRAAGLNCLEESAVGEYILGSKRV